MRKTGWWMAIVAISILLVISPAQAKSKKYRPFSPGIGKQWVEIDPALEYPDFEYNELTPSCSACPPSLDPEGAPIFYDPKFTFFAKGGKQNNLVIFFQGGGACWDSINCLYMHTYSQERRETVEYLDSTATGIFDVRNPQNPFKKWGFVYIPYCTGDLHWGANDAVYEDVLGAYGGAPQTIQHRGFVNFQVVLKWLKDNTSNPKRIFVTGSSAGSYGATMAFAYIKEAFPRSRLYLLGDAGNGVTSDQFVEEGLDNWDPQMPEWIFGDTEEISDDDEPTWPTISEMYTSLSETYPRVRVGQYTTAWDATQVFFYNVMLNIPPDPDLDLYELYEIWNYPDADVWCGWHQQMLDYAYDTADAAPNYRYYIAAGIDHTILRDPKFYTEKVAGIPFAKWVKAMVYKPFHVNHSRGKGRWRNVECEDCDAVIPDCSLVPVE